MLNTRTHKTHAQGSCFPDRERFRGVFALSALASFLALPLTAPGMDLDKKVAFHIPAQDLSAALIEFSKQARLQVIVSDDLTGQTTQGVSGQRVIKQALNQLLEPAGLRYRVSGETSITVSKTAATEAHTTHAGHDGSWQVGWHQDLSIAVRNRSDVDGYTSWSTKEGVTHVQPPVAVLEQMLIARLHLDPADESNGALWVSPGSHRLGRLPASEAVGTAERLGKHLCAVNAGDVLLFRPLTLHASRKGGSARQRRVVHLEFAGASLPAPLAWAEVER
jgi:ectoine hydroxylase-related dioxygenase (phytanoyl-CoA dioxygenase family)